MLAVLTLEFGEQAGAIADRFTFNIGLVEDAEQVLGGLGPNGNPGEPATADFSAIAGDQFFTVSQGTDVAVAFAPNVTAGELFSGTLASVLASDDSRYCIFDDSGSLVGQIEFSSFAPSATPASLKFVLEASAARPGLSMTTELLSRLTNDYDHAVGVEASTTDTVVYNEAPIPANFVNSGNFIAARVTWAPINDEDPSQDGWLLCVDLAKWIVQ